MSNSIHTMKDYLLIFVYILLLVASAAAQDVTRLEKIGDVADVRRDDRSAILNCTDNSQVRITVLAPDLIRVRASFSKQLAKRDHLWAIEKTNWPKPRWNPYFGTQITKAPLCCHPFSIGGEWVTSGPQS